MTSQNSLDGYRHIVNLSTNVQETYQYDPDGGKLFVPLGAPQQTATDGSAETSKNYVGQNLCAVSSVVFYAGIVIASFVGGVLAGFAFMILRFSPYYVSHFLRTRRSAHAENMDISGPTRTMR